MSDAQEATQSSERGIDALFGYIGQQESLAAANDGTVTPVVVDAPNGTGVETGTVDGNATSSAQAQSASVTSSQGVQATDDQTASLQQDLARERKLRQDQTAMFTALAMEARNNETKMFEKSIESLSEEEQEFARTTRRLEQVEAENQLLKGTQQAQQRRQYEAQEQLDKTSFVQTLTGRLGLDASDPFLLQALMSATTPQEMVYTAQRIHLATTQAQKLTAQTEAVAAAQSGVFNAGQPEAPAAPTQRVAKHSGDLIGLMNERGYGQPL